MKKAHMHVASLETEGEQKETGNADKENMDKVNHGKECCGESASKTPLGFKDINVKAT